MQKILIIGCSCSGKTTLAKKMREVSGAPIYSNDVIHHKKQVVQNKRVEYVQFSEDEQINALNKITTQERWIIEGDIFNEFAFIGAGVIDKCDLVVFLDIGSFTLCYRSIKRGSRMLKKY